MQSVALNTKRNRDKEVLSDSHNIGQEIEKNSNDNMDENQENSPNKND